MKLSFTKMQGAGNDFVVLDATRAPLALGPAQLRHLGDRRFGVGCDQILVIEPARSAGLDFAYRIFNGASGEEVEHCGNGARCFVRYVVDKGLTSKRSIEVETVNRRLLLRLNDDGRVSVDMGPPDFEAASLPFDPTGLVPRLAGEQPLWTIDGAEFATVSMGNPHAVTLVDDVDTAPVLDLGPRIETHPRFPRRVNVGFLQVVSRKEARLRVFERDAGETLTCGTGTCAAVVAGIRMGLLDAAVEVHTRGGGLKIEWSGGSVIMTGPAETVYEGEIEL
ncbi:MAG: diaminopimelate epimerase [Paucibacter sp.]|nr:diaminopimelate epimerase [Roseateles sp.]